MAKDPDKFSDKEAQKRFEATLRGALKTPPKPMKKTATQKQRSSKAKTKPK